MAQSDKRRNTDRANCTEAKKEGFIIIRSCENHQGPHSYGSNIAGRGQLIRQEIALMKKKMENKHGSVLLIPLNQFGDEDQWPEDLDVNDLMNIEAILITQIVTRSPHTEMSHEIDDTRSTINGDEKSTEVVLQRNTDAYTIRRTARDNGAVIQDGIPLNAINDFFVTTDRTPEPTIDPDEHGQSL